MLGFPCNQFGAQEPGNADEIAEFCKVNFGVTFPLMAKGRRKRRLMPRPCYDWMKGGEKGPDGVNLDQVELYQVSDQSRG